MEGNTIIIATTTTNDNINRGLIGKEISISDHCKGLCVVADKDKIHVESEFTSLVFWQHGIAPY